ncbi:hypothetical protein JOF55_001787 [Haloactinomyces albus]|uniref:Uncharacterized protein n=1 Tax=Haloactinomyces albus TaxID=1352928 RepID=A0AAE3ZD73_9ACTN|nr:hypothetical protein [Haloactinomyces albus]MDR7301606.1 hypothetical protein [Haloactinomyces albus]
MVFIAQSLVSQARPMAGTMAWTTSTAAERLVLATTVSSRRRVASVAKKTGGKNTATLASNSTLVGVGT